MVSPRLRLHAALMVDAVIASAGDIFICVHASDKTIAMLGAGEEPGLKSVASTDRQPRYDHFPRARITG